MSIYKKEGIIERQCWRLCVGTNDYVHELFILRPNAENGCNTMSDKLCNCNSPNRVMKCNCLQCSEKYTMCRTRLRKNIMVFDYLPMVEMFCLLINGRSICKKCLLCGEIIQIRLKKTRQKRLIM